MQLADTNIVSELMRRLPHAGVMRWAESLDRLQRPIQISALTVDEIMFGLRRKPDPAKSAWFERFLELNLVLPATTEVARRAGQMRAEFSLKGSAREQADMLIAATAQVHALTLVTRNVRDFDGCGITVLNPFEG